MRGGFAIIAHKRVVTAGPPLIRPTGTFSLRAKSRLRRLRSDTRLRAQPLRGSLFIFYCTSAQVVSSPV